MTLQDLQIKVAQGNFSIKDFQDYYKKLSQEFSDFKEILENASSLKKDDKELKSLLQKISGQNASELIEKLKKRGYALRKNPNNDLKNSLQIWDIVSLNKLELVKEMMCIMVFLEFLLLQKHIFHLTL